MQVLSTNVAYQAYNFFRAPHWRWQQACQLVENRQRVSARHHDPAILVAVHYLRDRQCRWYQGEKQAQPNPWPTLSAAHHLYQDNGPRRWEMEARLLAGQTDDEIAACSDLPPEGVHGYEQTFFHVRDRLQARDWITAQVIRTALPDGFDEGDLAALWKVFAFRGGVRPLELVMAVTQNKPLPAWFGQDCLGDRAKAEARLRILVSLAVQAMTVPTAGMWQALFRAYRRCSGSDGKRRLRLTTQERLLQENCRFLDRLYSLRQQRPRVRVRSAEEKLEFVRGAEAGAACWLFASMTGLAEGKLSNESAKAGH